MNTVSNEHFRSERINLGPNELGTSLGTGLQNCGLRRKVWGNEGLL